MNHTICTSVLSLMSSREYPIQIKVVPYMELQNCPEGATIQLTVLDLLYDHLSE
jgi:hypothetical protein